MCIRPMTAARSAGALLPSRALPILTDNPLPFLWQICENHRSCKKWTHDFQGKKCSLFDKNADDHFELQFYSDERSDDPPDGVLAHLCFDCKLSSLGWAPPEGAEGGGARTDSFPRLRL